MHGRGARFIWLAACAAAWASGEAKRFPGTRLQTLRRPGVAGVARKSTLGWTSATYPLLGEAGSPACGRHSGYRICDPEDLLSNAAAQAVEAQLRQLTFGDNGALRCEPLGVEVWVMVLRSLDKEYASRFASTEDALSALAGDIGRRSGLLESNCPNSLVLAYGAKDGVIGIARGPSVPPATTIRGLSADNSVDEAVEDAAHQLVTSLFGENQGQRVTSIAISGNSHALDGSGTVEPTRIALSLVAGVLGLAWALLSVCCVYDTLAHWRHRARFSSCVAKLRRVHGVLTQASGELPLCPMCVDWISQGDESRGVYNRRVIVFLCGHRFHADCANKWFDKNPKKMGRCPTCDLPHTLSLPEQEACCGAETDACRAMNSIDEIKAFFLSSLQAQYPDIIKERDVKRWQACHTEIWLSELSCPWYHSIFASPKKHRWPTTEGMELTLPKLPYD